MNEHEQLVDRAARHAHTVVFLGGLDAGKSTLARATAAFGLRVGRSVAYIDADVAEKTVGPPTTVGMKHIRNADDLTLEALSRADALGFVGSTRPQDDLVALIGALQRLSDRARTEGADLIVVDTGGEISGIAGELLKYYMVDVLEPDLVAGLQRGQELEPIFGIVERFFGTEIVRASVHPDVVLTSVEERMIAHEKAMARYFQGEQQRFRIKPTVFVPTLPPLSDLESLDRLLVGLSDGAGGFIGLGLLGFVRQDGGLRLTTPVAEPPKALRLGSVRLEDTYRAKRVDLRSLFGTE
jgi:polynucleotide 5'-kinase involved in rRNA processing